MIKISTEFDKLDYTFNRSLSTVVTLPYDKDDVLLGVNELVNGYNFNSKLKPRINPWKIDLLNSSPAF